MLSGYRRLKPDRPRNGKNGKPAKYEAPKGLPNRAYFPPGTIAAIADASRPLLITEGEKKAAKADQEGFACIGLSGVWNWHNKRPRGPDGRGYGPRVLIDDLLAIPWDGRPIYIVFDSDASSNDNVLWAEYRLSQALQDRGAVIRIVRLPAGPPDASGKPTKMGLDDYLIQNSSADLQRLLDNATEPVRTLRADRPNEAIDDPHRLARSFLKSHQHPDGITLRRYRQTWLHWDGAAYRPVPEESMRARVCQHIRQEFDRLNLADIAALKQRIAAGKAPPDAVPPQARKVTKNLVSNVLEALNSLTLLSNDIEAPAWLDGAAGRVPPAEILAAKNGLVHLPSLGSERPLMLAPTPTFFSLNALEYDFDDKAPEPHQWLQFLNELFPHESGKDSVAFLQDFFGYVLTQDTRQQKMLLMVGPPRSGKGTIARVLTGLVGRSNVCGPTLASLSSDFGLQALLGKSLAIISDARLGHKSNLAVITERLLSISGEDRLSINRKHKDYHEATLGTRIVILTNELPQLTDASAALTSRFMVLHLTQSWLGKEDKNLTDRLLAELSGILLWAIKGWKRLQERGHFEQPASGRELAEELEGLGSPMRQFVRDRCELDGSVSVNALFNAWGQWCAENGHHCGAKGRFGKDLRAAVPGLRLVRVRLSVFGENDRERRYEGIRLRPAVSAAG
jgi:putative DNA primase/helicase